MRVSLDKISDVDPYPLDPNHFGLLDPESQTILEKQNLSDDLKRQFWAEVWIRIDCIMIQIHKIWQ